MKRAIRPPTKAEQQYQDAARTLGCVVCRWRIARGMQRAVQPGATHLHHRNIGDKHGAPQIGQHAVVAMCAWHHAGDVLFGMGVEAMRTIYGPSFHHHARDFRGWTADVLPGHRVGTEAWQFVQDSLLLSQGNGHLIPASRREVSA